MCEDVARSVHIARQLGTPMPIAPADVDALLRALPERLRPAPAAPGRSGGATMTADRPPRSSRTVRSGSSPGARRCTARRRCARSRSQSRGIAEQPRRRPSGRRRARVEAGAHRRRARSAGRCLDANGDDGCLGVITWMHTFSPAKMWIHGLDELRKPLLHLHTQANESLPWSTIDMDFMNLNQAAHGDREFAHVQTRLGVVRKTVAGHITDPEVVGRVVTLGAGRASGPRRCGTCAWSASATTCATSPSPRATRSRPSTASACR